MLCENRVCAVLLPQNFDEEKAVDKNKLPPWPRAKHSLS